jgi:hypothetical protein
MHVAARRHNQQKAEKGGQITRRRVRGESSFPGQQRVPGNVEAILFLQRTIGNRATANFVQRQQEEEEGSATVVGSASETEGATDAGSFTKDVTDEQRGDSTPTDEELDESLKKKSRQAHEVQRGTEFHTQHPSLAQLGIRPKEIKGKKLASYVGNEKYKADEWINLPGAKADARRMKAAMKGHDYETLEHVRDRSAPEIEALFKRAMAKAGAGDALLLYYAGHGIPGGVAGVDSEVEGKVAKDEAKKGNNRGLELVDESEEEEEGKAKSPYTGAYKGYKLTDISQYSQLMGPIEAGVGKGVHTTFISDACHSGTATDLVRDQAVEKLAKGGGDKKVKAVNGQINRLKDMKVQIPGASSQGSEGRGIKMPEESITLEEDQRPAAQVYWEDVVHPELKSIGAYLKEAGFAMTVPDKPGTYTKEGIEQQINAFINQLIDLGEAIEQESEKSTLAIAP